MSKYMSTIAADLRPETPAHQHQRDFKPAPQGKLRVNLRPPIFPAVDPAGSPNQNDAVRRAQSKQFAVPNATPSSVFTSDSRHQETPSSAGATTHDSHSSESVNLFEARFRGIY